VNPGVHSAGARAGTPSTRARETMPAAAVGAFGGFLIQVALRQASLSVATLVKAAET
jgi:hypothetical protein